MSKCVDTRPIEGCFIPNDTTLDNVGVVIHYIYNEDNVPVGQAYTLASDAETPIDITTYLGGGIVKVGACNVKKPNCVKSKALYTVIDNTGTSFANENLIKLYFTDGTDRTILQPVVSGWTAQLQSWDDLITDVLNSKCGAFSIETRYNPPPYNSSDLSTYTPPDGLLAPPSELWGLIPSMAYRYLQITACSTCPAINKAELLAVNGVELTTPILLTLTFVEGLEKRYDLCQDCGKEGVLFYQNTEIEVPESDYPVCFFDCGEQLPPVPESGCLFTIVDYCDDGVVDGNGNLKPVVARYSDCGDGAILTDIYEVDADGGLILYTPIGNIVDCDTGDDATPPTPVTFEEPFDIEYYCIDGLGKKESFYRNEDNIITSVVEDAPDYDCTKEQPTSIVKCYGAGSGDFAYTNADNTTDISYSIGGTGLNTIKWSSSGDDGSDTFTLEIVNCINSGETAVITITDANTGLIYSFSADSILGNGNGDGTGGYAFGGVGSASGSGKLGTATLSCGGSASGEAYLCTTCGEVPKWFDTITGVELLESQIETLYDCPLPEVCDTSTVEFVSCADEATAEAAIGDVILSTNTVDCNNVVLSSKQYNLTAGNIEITGGVLTTDCDPQPDVTQTEECLIDEKEQRWTEVTIITGLTTTTLYINQADNSIGTPIGDPANWTSCASLNVPVSVICKTACVKGVKVDVLIGVDSFGEYQWFKNLATGDLISEPDFAAECPELTCTTRTETVCADGDYTGINDGDAIILVIQDCSDGTSTITGATLLNNPTTSILPLPTGILFKDCDTAIETELIGCVTDEDGINWNVILIDGITVAYQNRSDNSFGTPTGATTECKEEVTLVGALDDKHCVEINGVVVEAFLFFNSDKSICAKPVGGINFYQQGEYKLVSCCDTETVETLFESGFTVARPADTPNTGWNNQKINNATPLSGDFELCFSITNMVNSSPQMIGINSDPTTNASYTSIDCALYFRLLNGLYRIYEYQNGAYGGLLYSGDFTNQEICYKRTGGLLTYTIGGAIIGSCNIGTADVFLDDSHYYAAGTWGSGTITYSDFNLVTRAEDEVIKSVSQCAVSEVEVTNLKEELAVTEIEICIDGNKSAKEVTTIIDGVSTVTYQDETGVIATPANFKYGSCKCDLIEYYELEDITGTLRSREWELGADVPLTFTIEQFAAIRESFDFSATTTVDVDIVNFGVNDTNTSATVQDAQVIEGFIVVSEPTLVRWSGTSYGYQSLEIGACCGSRELIMENRLGGGANTLTDEYTLPVGIHSIRIFNIDDYSNTSRNLQYSLDAGTTWVTDNTPPNVQFSKIKPTQECKSGYLCGGVYYESDCITPLVFAGTVSKSEILCGSVSGTSEVTGSVSIELPTVTTFDAIGDANYETDVEALPVVFAEGIVPVVAIDERERSYFAGHDANGDEVINNGGSTRVSLNESAVIRTQEQGRRLEWTHLDSDVDGQVITIPVGVQSWSIAIIDPNGPDPLVTMVNGQRSVPAPVGVIEGNSENDMGILNHPIVSDANGNRLYIVYATKV